MNALDALLADSSINAQPPARPATRNVHQDTLGAELFEVPHRQLSTVDDESDFLSMFKADKGENRCVLLHY